MILEVSLFTLEFAPSVARFRPHSNLVNLDSAVERVLFNAEVEAQRKQLVLSFVKVIFFYATPHHRHPMGEDSFRQKILVFSIFHITSLFLCVTLRLCASALKSTAVFRIRA